MISYEKFTDRSRKVILYANQEAGRLNHEYVGTEHILLGLMREGTGVGFHVLKSLNLDLRTLRLEILKLSPKGVNEIIREPIETPRTKRVIEQAIDQAKTLDHNYVGTEHLLLGTLLVTEGMACKVLTNLGHSPENIREDVLHLLGVETTPTEIVAPNTFDWDYQNELPDATKHLWMTDKVLRFETLLRELMNLPKDKPIKRITVTME